MTRLLVAACAVVLTACGGRSAPSLPAQGPPSAQSVAENSSDFSGVQKCPESGSYDNYLKAEQSKAADQYTKDSKDWNDLKSGGADDAYIAVYAENTSDCGQFGAGTPTGKVAYVYGIRFKDSTSAASAYKTQSAAFHLSDSDIANLKAAGGTVQQGSTTGLSENSIVVTIDLQGTTFYIALWQNKEFEVAMIDYNLPLTDASAVATKINGRIH